MACLTSKTLVIFFILTAHMIPGDADSIFTRVKLAQLKDSEGAFLASNFFDNTVNLTSQRTPQVTGFEPGDVATSFKVATLDGEFVYPPPTGMHGSVVIHAFTKNSGFLEYMWNSESSLAALVEELPENTKVLFLSFDDSSVTDALWMREQVHRAAVQRKKEEVLSRLYFSPVPVFAQGNWIPGVLYSWSCTGHNCGLSQAVFSSALWKMPIIVKRLDARYDWLSGRWGVSNQVIDAGNGCEPAPSVSGSVAWVSEGNCSFFTKVKNMVRSNASGVLVYAHPGNPIQDMNCVADECSEPLSIPAAMVHLEPSVVQALQNGQLVNVSFQVTPSPNFFFGINQQGSLAEMGWFLYPTFKFINWQAQWFDYYEGLQHQLQSPAKVVTVYDKVQMQGELGAFTTVDLPSDMSDFNMLELDASLSCPGRRDSTCAHWDHTVQLYVCCDHFSPFCNMELGRWITAFRRGTGRWLTDVSPLIPLLNNGRCTFTIKTVAWAMPWVVSLNLRFSHVNQTGSPLDKLFPFKLLPLYNGGTFDKNYNKRYEPMKFTVPASTKKVELYAVITGHGSDDNGCGEFCVTSHHFLVNGAFNNTRRFDSAGTALGCAMRVGEGAVPNEHGTWLYGRGGWCDGLQVNPWRVDITQQVDISGYEANTLLYFGLYNGQDPNPSRDPGNIVMFSYLVFYK